MATPTKKDAPQSSTAAKKPSPAPAAKAPAAQPKPTATTTPTASTLPSSTTSGGAGTGNATTSKMSRREVSPDQIAQRAYELWQKRGGDHGRDQDDWLRAERELRDGGKH